MSRVSISLHQTTHNDFDFILYYNLLRCFFPLEMHVRLICAIKFYLLSYLTVKLRIKYKRTKPNGIIGEVRRNNAER